MKTKIFMSVALAAFLSGCGGGGGGDSASSTDNTGGTDTNNTVTPTSYSVTVVDGYVKEAVVTDADGIVATEIGNGEYSFSTQPQYPIMAIGGSLVDTNQSFDITMISYGGNVISPLTTLIGSGDSDVLNALSNATGLGADLNSFAVDYVESNNTNMAKLSQLSYLLIKDNLVSDFKTQIGATLPASLELFYDAVEASFNASGAYTNMHKTLRNKQIEAIAALNGGVDGFELALANFKKNIDATADNDDFDGDGVPNKLEIDNGFDPANPLDINGSADNDNDGVSNLKEMQLAPHFNMDYNSTLSILPNWEVENTDDGKILKIKESFATDNGLQYMSIADDAGSNTSKTFDSANQYCQDLVYGGFDDWRLPTDIEAQGLFSEQSYGRISTAVNLYLFADNIVSGYNGSFSEVAYKRKFAWSSTEVDQNTARIVNLWQEYTLGGNIIDRAKDNTYSSICVREYTPSIQN